MYRDDEAAGRMLEEAAGKRVAELELRRLCTSLWQLRDELSEKAQLFSALGHDVESMRRAARPRHRQLRLLALGLGVFAALFFPLLVALAC